MGGEAGVGFPTRAQLRAVAICQSSLDRRSVQPRPERRGREPESRRRQTDAQRRRCHRESQRRLEDDRLSVDPHGHTGAGVDLEVLRGPLAPPVEPPDLTEGIEGNELGSLQRAGDLDRNDTEPAGVQARSRAGAGEAIEDIRVVRDEEQLRRRCSVPSAPRKRRSNGVARGPSSSGSIFSTVFSLSSRYASDWTISA